MTDNARNMTDIIGIEKIGTMILLDLMHKCMMSDTCHSYANIPSKDPELYIRELYNAEVILSNRFYPNNEVKKAAQSYFENWKIWMLNSLRWFSDLSQEDCFNILLEIFRSFYKDRVYIESRSTTEKRIRKEKSKYLKETYAFDYSDISRMLGVSEISVKKYNAEKDKSEKDEMVSMCADEIRRKRDNSHKQILNQQDGKLYIRKNQLSNTLYCIDTNIQEGEKGSFYEISEDEFRNINKKLIS